MHDGRKQIYSGEQETVRIRNMRAHLRYGGADLEMLLIGELVPWRSLDELRRESKLIQDLSKLKKK
jgi:hypothetical protein